MMRFFVVFACLATVHAVKTQTKAVRYYQEVIRAFEDMTQKRQLALDEAEAKKKADSCKYKKEIGRLTEEHAIAVEQESYWKTTAATIKVRAEAAQFKVDHNQKKINDAMEEKKKKSDGCQAAQ